ncbi:MAG: DUF1634 domain-containing protein [Planctomycetes bacterium]|nr:DUF1634 domain-containing protein [Planctomycetota bacterium]
MLGLGVVCLLATPLLRIASALALFLREGDRTYVAIEFAVLVIVLSSAVLEWATRHGAH